MLLPSALDCAPGIQPMRAVYTTNTVLSPPPSHRQSTNSPANLFSTCRALQSLITTNFTPPPTIAKPSCAQPSLASPIILAPPNRPQSKRSAQTPQPSTSTNAPHPQTPPPASKKRRRSNSDNENRPPSHQDSDTTLPSTPKRQRLHPPTLPLGLSRADFSALQAEAAAIPIPSTPLRRRHQHTTRLNTSSTSNTPPSSTSPNTAPSHSPDTNALISLILQKLNLSQHDWDECARGKENSIGERFRMLLGNEGVGLRRGGGKRRRKSVVGMEFGPLLEG